MLTLSGVQAGFQADENRRCEIPQAVAYLKIWATAPTQAVLMSTIITVIKPTKQLHIRRDWTIIQQVSLDLFMGNFNCEELIKLELLFYKQFCYCGKKYGLGQSSLHTLVISLINTFMKQNAESPLLLFRIRSCLITLSLKWFFFCTAFPIYSPSGLPVFREIHLS